MDDPTEDMVKVEAIPKVMLKETHLELIKLVVISTPTEPYYWHRFKLCRTVRKGIQLSHDSECLAKVTVTKVEKIPNLDIGIGWKCLSCQAICFQEPMTHIWKHPIPIQGHGTKLI